MKRAIVTILIATTTLATAPAAFGATRDRSCGPDTRNGVCTVPERNGERSDNRSDNRSDHHRNSTPHAERQDTRPDSKTRVIRKARKSVSPRGHAPSAAQLRRLPRAPRGQEYRVIDNRVVRVDSDTLQTVAVLGLLSALFN